MQLGTHKCKIIEYAAHLLLIFRSNVGLAKQHERIDVITGIEAPTEDSMTFHAGTKLDENGNLPGIERPFLVDAIGTCIGALTGNTTITTFVESTSGVEAGGRTGLTALVTGIMFLLTIFLAPLFVAIPYAATGPALIYVGFLMLKGFTEIDFTDFDEAIGPCVMMMFTAFTGNITNGLGAGIIVHVLVKLVRGKAKEIHPIMYLLCALMVLYFIVG